MAWDTPPEDWTPAPKGREIPPLELDDTPPVTPPSPYDVTRDWQREHGGSWADVSRHLWGD